MTETLHSPGVLALELSQGGAPARLSLSRDEAAELAAHIAADLARLLPAGPAGPGAEAADLIVLGALYDHAQLLRPGWPLYAELAQLSCAADADPDDLNRAIDAVAGLTAVDGATIINERYDLLAFGTKIARRRGSAPVELVNLTEPVEGSSASIATPGQLGGTRHLSAAQFVHDQRDATALVASQDGRFTIFKWSQREQFVHAHRVDALLL